MLAQGSGLVEGCMPSRHDGRPLRIRDPGRLREEPIACARDALGTEGVAGLTAEAVVQMSTVQGSPSSQLSVRICRRAAGRREEEVLSSWRSTTIDEGAARTDRTVDVVEVVQVVTRGSYLVLEVDGAVEVEVEVGSRS
jgi:hypothetical protein